MNTCKTGLKDKVREGLINVLSLESDGPSILKFMLDIILDINNSSLHSITQSLQALRLKDAPGENISVVVSYLKGAVILLHNCTFLPTYLIDLLNDIMCFANNDEFCAYMKVIHSNYLQKKEFINCMLYLGFAEFEYMELYRTKKWEVSKSDPVSDFFVGED